VKLRHKARIGGMYVAPEARGQGVGKALLTAAIA
jgi:GNAT superfamily N-acetyltransferase